MSKAYFLKEDGTYALIQNQLLDEAAAVQTLNDNLLDEAAVLQQIFFATIIPTIPQTGYVRMFSSKFDVRFYKATDKRIFKA